MVSYAVDMPLLLGGLQRLEHELLLFASFWFIVAAIDELAIDFVWLWLKLTGRARDRRLPADQPAGPLTGRIAVLVPAWLEADVIGAMVAHTLAVWPQREMVLFIGGYCNDTATLAAARAGAAGDPRLRLVVNPRPGPTTKADCLNRLYDGLRDEERSSGAIFTGVILHDAEDMVHPAALRVIDRALAEVDFVQLPVRPEPQDDAQLVAGHYADEFTEAHAKAMVVRNALGAAIPAAGVGCGFARKALGQLAASRAAAGEDGPFSAECLTEDYELGMLFSSGGRKGRFLRMRDGDGELVATRAFFPGTVDEAVRQKARWIHGIAFQGWDRLGWSRRPIDVWMALRDRHGPLTAVVLTAAYSLVVIEGVLALAEQFGWQRPWGLSPLLRIMLAISFASFVWRALWRFGFTASEYGLVEGARAVIRIPVANFIAILAGRRALTAYFRTLRGAAIVWDKTRHRAHPAGTLVAEPIAMEAAE